MAHVNEPVQQVIQAHFDSATPNLLLLKISFTGKLLGLRVDVEDAPAGGDARFDLNKGTNLSDLASVHADPADRLSVDDGTNSGTVTVDEDISPGDLLAVDLDSTPSSIGGPVYITLLLFNSDTAFTIKETDNTPTIDDARIINVSNGTLTDEGDGEVTIGTGGGGGSLSVKEIDGTPDVSSVDTLIVTNGKLTDNEDGSVTIDLTGGNVNRTFLVLPSSSPGGSSTGSPSGGSPNNVRLFRFYLDHTIVINSLGCKVTTLVASSHIGVGIYSEDGNTLLVDSGPISSGTTGIKTVTLGSPVTLSPGNYWFAITGTSVSIRVVSINYAQNEVDVMNAVETIIGDAANTSSGGQLPATTGSISATSSGVQNVAVVSFT